MYPAMEQELGSCMYGYFAYEKRIFNGLLATESCSPHPVCIFLIRPLT